MQNTTLGNALLSFIMGCLISYKGTYAVSVGIPIDLKEYKYLLALIFFSLSLYLILKKDKET